VDVNPNKSLIRKIHLSTSISDAIRIRANQF
jgi:hypothetical protein